MRNFYRFHRVLPTVVFPIAGISAISKWKNQIQAKELPFRNNKDLF